MSAFELIRDLHKDARGFRPSVDWMEAFNASTFEEQEATWESLCDELERREAHERDEEAHALAVFERRLEDMVADYGIDLATALRWDMESFEVDVNETLAYHGTASQEIEFYFWKQGLAQKEWPRYVALAYKAYGLNQYGVRTEEAA